MIVRVLLLFAAAPLLGCGNGASSGPAADAGGAETASAGDDGAADGSCFPFCGTGTGADASAGAAADAAADGPPSCAQLQALYESLEAQAKACNPQLPNQCSAATNDPCCPVTVTASNTQAVTDFDYAVMQYKALCTPDCSMRICQPAPSDTCDPLGTSTGRCQ